MKTFEEIVGEMDMYCAQASLAAVYAKLCTAMGEDYDTFKTFVETMCYRISVINSHIARLSTVPSEVFCDQSTLDYVTISGQTAHEGKSNG